MRKCNIWLFFVAFLLVYSYALTQENIRITPQVKAASMAMPATVSIKVQEKKLQKSLGSGVVIEQSGLVLTNFHVVENQENLKVVFFDDNEYSAEMILRDEQNDLALLKLKSTKGRKFPVIKFALPRDLYLAESIIAIGSPQGLDLSVTEGIVSALNRVLKVNQKIIHPHLIQVSVKANKGNSGGPVVNLNGEMIGLLVATKTSTQGIGFALPIETIHEALKKWLAPEHHLGKELGFDIVTGVNTEQRTAAVLVKNVRKGTLNHLLGVKDDMIITKVNDVSIKTAIDFYRELLKYKSKNTIKLTLLDGHVQTAKLFELRGLKLAKVKLGLSLEANWRELAKAFSIPFHQGYVISGIENISGYLSNIRKGDML